MTAIAKRTTLILLGLVTILTMMIASGLPQLELRPGMPLPSLNNGQVAIPVEELQPPVVFQVNEAFKVLLALVLAGLMLYVVYKVIRGAGWAIAREYFQTVLVIVLVAGSITFLVMLLPMTQDPLIMELPLPAQAPEVRTPLGPVPVLLFWVVGIALLMASLLLGIWIFRPSRQQSTLDLLGREAENARQALMKGRDLKDVIITCYRQMSLAVEKEQGIEREESMTTREFEQVLEAAGLPHDPVHQLTGLFEAVRYGNWQPAPLDEQKAIHCLQAIVVSSHAAKKDG